MKLRNSEQKRVNGALFGIPSSLSIWRRDFRALGPFEGARSIFRMEWLPLSSGIWTFKEYF